MNCNRNGDLAVAQKFPVTQIRQADFFFSVAQFFKFSHVGNFFFFPAYRVEAFVPEMVGLVCVYERALVLRASAPAFPALRAFAPVFLLGAVAVVDRSAHLPYFLFKIDWHITSSFLSLGAGELSFPSSLGSPSMDFILFFPLGAANQTCMTHFCASI